MRLSLGKNARLPLHLKQHPLQDSLYLTCPYYHTGETTVKIKGQTAIVSGGASGLGEGTARALTEAGAKVAVLDLNRDAALKVAKDIGGLAIPCDVADAESTEIALAEVVAAFGAPAILVTCAGIAPAARIVGRNGPQALSAFRQVIEVNLIGTFNIMRITASHMANRDPNKDGERGVIITTSSVAAFEGQIGQAAYAASKGGIASLTLPAAREFSSIGIRVLCIAPGLFATPLLLGMPEPVQNSLAESLPFPKRFGTPAEYAELALHLITNPVMNGTTIRIDSALRMAPK